MRKIISYLILVFLASTAAANELASEQEKLKTIEKEIADLSKSLEYDASRQEKFQSMLRELDLKIGELAPMLQESNRQILQSQAAIHTLKQDQLQAKLDLEQQQEHLSEQMRSAYLVQQSSLLKLLLSQSNPNDFNRLLHYYRYFNLARQAEIAQVQEELNGILKREILIAQTLSTIKTLQQEQLQQFQDLQEKQKRREALLIGLNHEVTQKGDQITQLKTDASGLNKIIARLEKQRDQATSHQITASKGGLLWPAEGELVYSYGAQRHDDRVRWTGIFIGSTEGDPVKAVHAGRVVYADWLRGYGLLLIVDHGDDIMSLYGYNQSINKQVDDWVSANETIATIGKSGGLPAPGLYFEIRQAGSPIDPMVWIQQQS